MKAPSNSNSCVCGSMLFKRLAFFSLLFGLAACTQVNSSALKPPMPLFTATNPSLPTSMSDPSLNQVATPSPIPTRLLSICLVNEPRSLFLYDAVSDSEKSVLEAIYDGPIDIKDYVASPVILAKMPSQADGDAFLQSVPVNSGDLIVDANGNLTNLDQNALYRPSGCTERGCAQAYSGSESIKMDQLVVRFKLLPGLQWSDGASLTAGDSVYSYEVARSLNPVALPEQVSRTHSYKAIDELTVEWTGVPGFIDGQYQTKFFSPLPQHTWTKIPVSELSSNEASSHKPIGWGPYVIDEWVPGDHISLHKNPLYFRTGDNLPYFDNLVFRFVDDASQAVDAILADECDLMERTALTEAQTSRLSELQTANKVLIFDQKDISWEQITFGINPLDKQRPQFFGLKEVRRAVAMCINRQALVEQLANGQLQAADLYLPSDHPLYNSEATHYSYDPEAAAQLLTAAGWLDVDNDPSTPRIAQGVSGVADGTAFSVQFLTSDDAEHQTVAQMIQADLKVCGIQVNNTFQPVQKYLASGPEGPVFGRSFDLAQFAWETALEPPCYLYLTSEIPGPYPEYPIGWGGVNAAGYSDPAFDQACEDAMFSLPDSEQHRSAHLLAQEIFSEQLPALPLYARSELVVTRPDFCNIASTSAVDSALWNLERFNYGSGCSR